MLRDGSPSMAFNLLCDSTGIKVPPLISLSQRQVVESLTLQLGKRVMIMTMRASHKIDLLGGKPKAVQEGFDSFFRQIQAERVVFPLRIPQDSLLLTGLTLSLGVISWGLNRTAPSWSSRVLYYRLRRLDLRGHWACLGGWWRWSWLGSSRLSLVRDANGEVLTRGHSRPRHRLTREWNVLHHTVTWSPLRACNLIPQVLEEVS